MRVLIVFAHPERASFSAALKGAAVETLAGLGHAVAVSDLYAEGFDAVGGPGDIVHRPAAPFDYQEEQRRAVRDGTFVTDISERQRQLLACDALMLNFPMWWYGPPAILKGWIDRVLAAGFAYDRDRRYATGPLAGRAGMLTVTTGSPPERYTDVGERPFLTMEQLLRPLQKGLFHFVGMKAVDPFIAYSAARVDGARRAHYLDEYRARLAREFGSG